MIKCISAYLTLILLYLNILLSFCNICYQDSINIIFHEKVFNNVINNVMKKKFIDNL